jgi:hypothetical protein
MRVTIVIAVVVVMGCVPQTQAPGGGSPEGLQTTAPAGKPRGLPGGPATISVEYDRFKDTTKVTYHYWVNRRDSVFATYSYRGTDISEVDAPSFLLVFGFIRDTWTYMRRHATSFLVDGVPHEPREVRWHGDAERGLVSEVVGVEMGGRLLEAIRSASHVEYRVGSTEGSISGQPLEMLQAFLRYEVPVE